MDVMRPKWIIGHKSRLLAIVPVLIVFNLSLGTPLLCRLHCPSPASELISDEHLLHRHGQDTGKALIVTNATQSPRAQPFGEREEVAQLLTASPEPVASLTVFSCSGEHPGSNYLVMSATFEFADLSGSLPVEAEMINAFRTTPGATLASLYLPPPEKPPTASS